MMDIFIKNKQNILILLYLIPFVSYSQVSNNSGILFAKEYSKDIASYRAKEFVINNILGVDTTIVQFEIDPLAASSSGELTTLIYMCKQKKMNGLILGFFGNRWNEAGVMYQSYSFKNFNEKKGNELLSKLDSLINKHHKYINSDSNTNNIYFRNDDMTYLIYKNKLNIVIQVFWNGYDSVWDYSAFKRTRRRFDNFSE